MKLILTILFCISTIITNSQNWISVAEVNTGHIELLSFKDKLFASGNFTLIEGIPARGIAHYNNKDWKSFLLDELPYTAINSLTIFNDQLFAFGSIEPSLGYGEIIKYNEFENTWVPLPNSQVLNYLGNGNYEAGTIDHAIEFKGDLYVTGDFDFIGDKPAKNIAKWNGIEWQQVLDDNEFGIVLIHTTSIEKYNDKLIIAGYALDLNTNNGERILSWDGENLEVLDQGLVRNEDPRINDFEVYNGELYAACTFCFFPDDDNDYNLIKWNGLHWEGVKGFEQNELRIKALKNFSGYLAISVSTPNHSVFLFNGDSNNKIDQEFNYPITSLQEYNKQLFATGGAGLNSNLTGIAKLGRIIINPETESKCSFSPNPFTNDFLIGYENLENSKTIISFLNLSGVILKKEVFNDLKGVYLRKFDLIDFPSGVYIINLLTKGINESRMVIKK